MNNNLQDRRFLVLETSHIKEAIPAQRTYELSLLHGHDDKLFEELLNETEDTEAQLQIGLYSSIKQMVKILMKFQDYFQFSKLYQFLMIRDQLLLKERSYQEH